MSYLAAQPWTQQTFPAIYQIRNTLTEPSRLQVTLSQPLLAPQVFVSRRPLKPQITTCGTRFPNWLFKPNSRNPAFLKLGWLHKIHVAFSK
jgi:hypothetical protein